MPLYTEKEVAGLVNGVAAAAGMVVIRESLSGGADHTDLGRNHVLVHNAPPSKRLRHFNGKPHKHCSGCPFPEGCVMCTLP